MQSNADRELELEEAGWEEKLERRKDYGGVWGGERRREVTEI